MRPFGPVQKLLPIFGKRDVRIRGDSASSAQPASSASQPAHKRDRKWAIIKRKKNIIANHHHAK